jgi:hypothetical protein
LPRRDPIARISLVSYDSNVPLLAHAVLLQGQMSTAKNVEELEVYQKALKAAEDASELLKRPSLNCGHNSFSP